MGRRGRYGEHLHARRSGRSTSSCGEHLGPHRRLPLDEEHEGLHVLLDDVRRRTQVLSVLRALLLLILGLEELELVARVVLLEVEHHSPARVERDQLEQLVLHLMRDVIQSQLGRPSRVERA